MFEFREIVDQLRDHFNDDDRKTWLGLDNLKKLAVYFKVSEDEVLRAMREVAGNEKLRYGESRCSSCGMPIHFRNRTPFDRSQENHFIACPNRAAHRRS